MLCHYLTHNHVCVYPRKLCKAIIKDGKCRQLYRAEITATIALSLYTITYVTRPKLMEKTAQRLLITP